MKNNIQKIKRFSCRFASFLAVCLLLVCMSAPAFAAENDYTLSGRWCFDESPVVSGTFSDTNLDFTVSYLTSDGAVFNGSGSFVELSSNDILGPHIVLQFVSSQPAFPGISFPFDLCIYSTGLYPSFNDYPPKAGWQDQVFTENSLRYIDFGSEPQIVSVEFYHAFISVADPVDITLPVTDTLPVVLGWVGLVVSSLFSGELSGLLILVAIPVAIVIVFLGARLLRRLWWGA